jgi:L-rhamnose isomerase
MVMVNEGGFSVVILDGEKVNQAYAAAKEIYAQYGVDTENVMEKIRKIPISLHCWQGDDVAGFESSSGISGGGIMATGNYPGRARNGAELRQDLDKALSLIPGKQRVNLHAMYAETDVIPVGRDELTIDHFKNWVDWAKAKGIGLDFNPTFFAHPLADSGYTLSSTDDKVRKFWIEHGKRSREIAAEIGKTLKTPCVNNIWIPDGSKDIPADRLSNRQILKEALDEVLASKFSDDHLVDAVESKLFGIGSESYVVGSHEFYMGYTISNPDVALCLDAGHFHPTENIYDKISALLTYKEKLLLHVSRGVRWDSDHVVLFNDDTQAIMQEIKRCNAFGKVSIALDFFDASINRITAWVTGTRAALKAILYSLLEPTHLLVEAEKNGNFGNRLALLEEFKGLPFAAVWNKYCQENNVPVGTAWLDEVKKYEDTVLTMRK